MIDIQESSPLTETLCCDSRQKGSIPLAVHDAFSQIDDISYESIKARISNTSIRNHR
jgi:hypothetical protein